MCCNMITQNALFNIVKGLTLKILWYIYAAKEVKKQFLKLIYYGSFINMIIYGRSNLWSWHN